MRDKRVGAGLGEERPETVMACEAREEKDSRLVGNITKVRQSHQQVHKPQ